LPQDVPGRGVPRRRARAEVLTSNRLGTGVQHRPGRTGARKSNLEPFPRVNSNPPPRHTLCLIGFPLSKSPEAGAKGGLDEPLEGILYALRSKHLVRPQSLEMPTSSKV
jgi:hypothetical protein